MPRAAVHVEPDPEPLLGGARASAGRLGGLVVSNAIACVVAGVLHGGVTGASSPCWGLAALAADAVEEGWGRALGPQDGHDVAGIIGVRGGGARNSMGVEERREHAGTRQSRGGVPRRRPPRGWPRGGGPSGRGHARQTRGEQTGRRGPGGLQEGAQAGRPPARRRALRRPLRHQSNWRRRGGGRRWDASAKMESTSKGGRPRDSEMHQVH